MQMCGAGCSLREGSWVGGGDDWSLWRSAVGDAGLSLLRLQILTGRGAERSIVGAVSFKCVVPVALFSIAIIWLLKSADDGNRFNNVRNLM